MNTQLEAASEQAQTWAGNGPTALLPTPCRFRSLENLLDAAAEAAEARERAEAAPQTFLPFAARR